MLGVVEEVAAREHAFSQVDEDGGFARDGFTLHFAHSFGIWNKIRDPAEFVLSECCGGLLIRRLGSIISFVDLDRRHELAVVVGAVEQDGDMARK